MNIQHLFKLTISTTPANLAIRTQRSLTIRVGTITVVGRMNLCNAVINPLALILVASGTEEGLGSGAIQATGSSLEGLATEGALNSGFFLAGFASAGFRTILPNLVTSAEELFSTHKAMDSQAAFPDPSVFLYNVISFHTLWVKASLTLVLFFVFFWRRGGDFLLTRRQFFGFLVPLSVMFLAER